MIKINDKNIFSVYLGEKVISKIYKGALLVYEAFKKLKASGLFPLTLNKCKGVDLVDYKIYGNSRQAILPEEYQQVEYIESTGTQYIDTGVEGNQDIGFDVTFLSKNSLSANIGEYGCIFGSRQGSTVKEIQLTTFSTDVYKKGVLRYGTTANNAGITVNKKMNITLLNKKYSNNDDISYTLTETTFNSGCNITIFALNQKGVSIIQHGSLQLYKLKLYNGEILIRDFIPCYRIKDNVIGLYDLVNGVFYTNAGTGVFEKGNNAPTPDTPIEVESVGDYDEATGKYRIPVKVSGKNKLNPSLWKTEKTQYGLTIQYDEKEDCFVINGTAASTYSYYLQYINIPAIIGGEYSFIVDYVSGRITRPNETEYAMVYFGSSDTINTNSNWTATSMYEYTSSRENIICNKQYISAMWFYISAGVSFDNYKIRMQIEEGETTKYEPHVEPVTTNIYLDEPLRKIGNYEDYIDFKKKLVIREIGETILNGTETYKSLSSNNTFYTSLPLALDVYQGGIQVCSHFKNTKTTMVHGFFRKSDVIYFQNDNVSTIEEFTNWVKEQYSNSTPLTVDYALVESTEKTIELPNIPTHKGTTILSVDTTIQPSNAEVIYMGKP